MSKRILAGMLALALAGAACGDDGSNNDSEPGVVVADVEPFADDCTTTLGPAAFEGKSLDELTDEEFAAVAEANRVAITETLVAPSSGDVICLADGTYALIAGLTLNASDVSDIEIRGQSQDGTILDFDGQEDGANGILVKGIDDFRAANFTIKNTAGDGIKVQNADGVELVNLTVTWDIGPDTDNGAYGVYPVLDKNVLVEGCVVSHASDAGIYVGQTDTVIARNNEAFGNVAGLEIENTSNAEVYDNHLHDNTGGLLIFNLPGLDIKDGSHNKIRNNIIENNNQVNFAKSGTIVSLVPKGVGVLLLSTDNNEVHDNEIKNNDSLGLGIISYELTGKDHSDAEYDIYSEANYIHDNTFENNGNDPSGMALTLNGQQPLPSLVIDGYMSPEIGSTLTFEDARDCFSANKMTDGNPAGFLNINAAGADAPEGIDDCDSDWTAFCHFDCTRDPLPSVTLE